LTKVLGAISAAIHKDVLLDAGKGHSAGAPTPHLSALQGRRLAWASEPEKGARFNVGQIKELSGGGEIPTRGLHEKKYTKIQPSHLLLLLTNHKPHADANDTAFWDRLVMITFNMRFVDNPVEQNERKKDTTLWARLEEEASGILAWLVRGCLEWQRVGLNIPDQVKRDGKNYRDQEDELKTFLDECCVIAENVKVKASTLYSAYTKWAESGNLYVLNRTNFGLQLSKKKFQKKNTKHGILYEGIGLLDTIEGEGLVNSSPKPFTQYKPATGACSEVTSKNEVNSGEQFLGVSSKNGSIRTDFLEKPDKTIHTIHPSEEDSMLDQPVEPVNGLVNSSQNPSPTIHPQTCLSHSTREVFKTTATGRYCKKCWDERQALENRCKEIAESVNYRREAFGRNEVEGKGQWEALITSASDTKLELIIGLGKREMGR